MAVFNLSNAAGRGFNMSTTNSEGWAFGEADYTVTSQIVWDDGSTILFEVYGSANFDVFGANYTYIGAEIIFHDLYYGNNGQDILTIDNLNLYTTEYDLQSNAWVARLNAQNDEFYGNDYQDIIRAGYGDDLVVGFGGNDTLLGDQGWDDLWGGSGNDYLNGGTGVDWMYGGSGNDTFIVDSGSDRVFEVAGEGTDSALTSVSFALAAGQHIEVLATTSQTGVAAINLTGNELAQTISGNNGANTINGGAGNDVINGFSGNDVLTGGLGVDTMSGGLGNDVFYIDNAGDKLVEAAAQGSDAAYASVTFALAAGQHIETLATTSQTGIGVINLTGNELAQTISGNNGANTINGGAGNDVINGLAGNDFIYGGTGNDRLTGGAGYDSFVFNTAISAATNVDTITDFNPVYDTIRLDNAVMAGLGLNVGTLSAAGFWKSTTGLAHDSNDRIIYETDTGWLNYDSNGSAAGGAVHVAKLAPNLALTNADFLVI